VFQLPTVNDIIEMNQTTYILDQYYTLYILIDHHISLSYYQAAIDEAYTLSSQQPLPLVVPSPIMTSYTTLSIWISYLQTRYPGSCQNHNITSGFFSFGGFNLWNKNDRSNSNNDSDKRSNQIIILSILLVSLFLCMMCYLVMLSRQERIRKQKYDAVSEAERSSAFAATSPDDDDHDDDGTIDSSNIRSDHHQHNNNIDHHPRGGVDDNLLHVDRSLQLHDPDDVDNELL
jgi:hypothetical protein